MAYLNTAPSGGGIGSVFDRLTAQLDAQRQANALAAAYDGKPAPQGFLAKLLGLGSDDQQQQPAQPAAAPLSAAPAPATGGTSDPAAYAAPTPYAPQAVPSAASAPAPAPPAAPRGYSPAPAGPTPLFSASQGVPGSISPNTQRALQFYQQKGLSPLAASGLVGGYHVESGAGLDTNAANPGDGADGSTSRGIAQWNGPRAAAFQQFASANGLDPRSLDTQLQFSWAELNGPERATLDALQKAQNPAQATAAALGYERPAGWTAQNPYGANTFGKRLGATVALSGGLGAGAPALRAPQGASPYGGMPVGAFSDTASLPTFAASGQGMNLTPSAAFPVNADAGSTPRRGVGMNTRAADGTSVRTDSEGNAFDPATGQPTALGFNPATGMVGAPAQRAIAVAASDTAPGTAVASSRFAPLAQQPAPQAAPIQATPTQAVPSTPDVHDTIRRLLANPDTMALGTELWKSVLTKTPPGFEHIETADGRILAFNRGTGGLSLLANGQAKPIDMAPEHTLYDPGTRQALYTAPAADKTGDKGFQVVQVGQDQFGNKRYGRLNRSTGDVSPMAETDAPASSGQPVSDLHGGDFINTLDPQVAGQVKAIVEGRAPYPTGMLLKTPYGQQLAAYVTQADPSFETGNATSRVKVRNEFNSGGPSSPAGMITAGNTAIQHLGHLSDAAEALNNGRIPAFNAIGNTVAQGTGGGTAVTQFNNILGKYVEEATKFYRGSGGTEADIQRDLGNLSPNMSPTQLHTAIQTQVELLQSKINALQDRWRQGMGPMVGDFPIIQPDSRGALTRVAKRAGVAPTNAPQGYTPAASSMDALAQARSAIASGADPAAVRARLQQHGIDASGL